MIEPEKKAQHTRLRDTFKPWFVFRDAATGRFVTRWYAMLNKATTVSERRERKKKPESK